MITLTIMVNLLHFVEETIFICKSSIQNTKYFNGRMVFTVFERINFNKKKIGR